MWGRASKNGGPKLPCREARAGRDTLVFKVGYCQHFGVHDCYIECH